jgi:hypothetical protein
MNQTRIDTAKLRADAKAVEELLSEINKKVDPYLVSISDRERQGLPRVREGFFEVVRKIVKSVARFPEVAQMAGFDPAAVQEDLENAELIQNVADRSRILAQRIADTQMTWMAEAWIPTLTLYSVAKARARVDNKIREIVEPLANLFAVRSRKEDKPEK